MSSLNRRQFVAAACGACAACPALRALAEAAGEARAPVDVGPLEGFAAKGIHDPLGKGRRFFLVNRGGRLYAVSATCTHKRVGLVVKDGVFKCPRHGSGFTTDGRVTKAPAKRPLPRYAIRLDEGGRVVVDPGTAFTERDWDDPAAFVELSG